MIRLVRANSVNGATSVTLNGVTAGNLVVVWVKWEGSSSNASASISDGTSSLTMTTLGSVGTSSPNGQFGYILSSVASGNVTYTATVPTGGGFINIVAMEFQCDAGVPIYDTDNVGGSASGDPVSTANITTTGYDELVIGACGEFSGWTFVAGTINGANAAPIVSANSQTATWYANFSAPFTGAATADISAAGAIIVGVIAFKCPTTEQEGFEWIDDDVSGTALASQDTNITRAANQNTRLRVLVNTTGDTNARSYQIEYRKVGDTNWNKIGTQ